MSKLTIKSPAPIGLADIAEQASHSVEMMSQIRAAMLSPTTRKAAPVWNLSQLAQLLDIEKGSLTHRMSRGDLPQGALNEVGNRRQFTLAEVRTWVREYRISIPSLEHRVARLRQIDGAMPRLNAIPVGCPFNPRCPKVFDRCRVERPDLLDAGATRAACWLYSLSPPLVGGEREYV